MASSSSSGSSMSGRDDSAPFNRNSCTFRRLLALSGLIDDNVYLPIYGRYLNARRRNRAAAQSSTESEENNGQYQFRVMVYVSQFRPNEIKIRVVDNYIVVNGKHEELADPHGLIQREFTRRYLLPEGVEADTVKCHWSEHNLVIIEAGKKLKDASASNERLVPISLPTEEAIFG